jgi:hypothetical protein
MVYQLGCQLQQGDAAAPTPPGPPRILFAGMNVHAPHRESGDCVKPQPGSHPLVETRTPLVMFEPHPPVARMVPSEPLGPWAAPALERLLRAAEPGAPLVLDLRDSPVDAPAHVAAVLWADDVARELGVELEVLVGDMVGAELLEFAGVEAPVFTPDERPVAPRFVRRASAY